MSDIPDGYAIANCFGQGENSPGSRCPKFNLNIIEFEGIPVQPPGAYVQHPERLLDDSRKRFGLSL